MQFAIHKAGPAHPPLLAAIHAAVFPGGEAWGADIFAAHLSMPGVFGFFSESGGVVLSRVAADEAEILTIGTLPEVRGRGLGAALLEASAGHAASRGAARLFLEVSERNAPARLLYARAGFIEVGLRRRYYPDGSDALVLALDLTQRTRNSADSAPSSKLRT